ncbi:MAG: glycosyltransferase family 2 protein [Cyanobacteria bacterium]|nr:glycosyltransferase family 2 protein [Cyanobacteriota bacterium]MDW8199588.1 glycosyltransferase family 2 protein [Cyanobacteriota bacterium SKYGB_h_bin112]
MTASVWTSPLQLLVVIVNYRRPDLVVDCLRSLYPEVKALPSVRVAVVDNPSGDDSVAQISAAIAENHWHDWAYLLPAPYNGGYAYGNNFAIRPALQSAYPPSYVLLLNPDTQVRPGALHALLDFMEHHPHVGIAGSSFENADGSLWPIGFKFPSLWSELDDGLRLGFVTKLLKKHVVPQTLTPVAQPIDWLPGASLMIRKEVFDAIGLMDEDYFLYYEETDFCLQAKRAGWPCWYVPESRVMHIAGQSTGVTVRDQRPKRLPPYLFVSRRRFFVKNYGWLYAALADIIWLLGRSLWRLRQLIQCKPNNDPPYVLIDFFTNSVFFKRTISGRVTPPSSASLSNI